jgi:iron complex outermembrane receptor protein
MIRYPALATLSLPLLIASGFAYAQENVLEEIIVTAQKRSENVQDIPITIGVVSGEILDGFNIRNTNDLAAYVPGLTIQSTPQNLSQVTVRGLGTGSGGESLDQSVGLFIDGIWAGRIREFQASLFDVERVEVIKGTQTTLLGKNTSLGAVSIISRRPSYQLEGYVQADYELEYDSYYLTGALNVPSEFGDFRLAINDVSEEGYVDNLATGNEVPERTQTTYRASGAWDIGDNGALLVSYQYDDLEIKGDSFQPAMDTLGLMREMDPSANIGIDKTKNAFTSYGDTGEAEDDQISKRAVVQYDHQFGEYTVTSLSGWSEYDNERLTDSDFLSVDYLTTSFDSDYEQYSQELRLVSPGGRAFEYIAGLLYLDGDMEFSNLTDSRFPNDFLLLGIFPLDSTNEKFYDQKTEVWSAFGHGEYELNDRARITLGLRYTEEKKNALFERVRLRSGGSASDVIADILAPTLPPTPLERSEDNLDGSINFQLDIHEYTMAFASWARGSKSGGFTTEVTVVEDAEYDTEEADTTEIGIKMNLADGLGHLNASLFFTEIENFQIVTFTGTAFVTETVPAESYGAEIETRWALAPGLFVGASATYAEAEDKDSGLRLPYAPEWSASTDIHYERPFADSELILLVDAAINYRDDQYMQQDERSLDGALTLVDLRLGITNQDEDWELALVGRNLLDQTTSFGFDFPGFGGTDDYPTGTTTLGSQNRPLTVAIQARYNFR